MDIAGSIPAPGAKFNPNIFMHIDKELVKKVANLSNLILDDDETDRFTKEMGDVLGYAEQLNEIDVSDVEPTDQVTGLSNVFREDIVIDYPADKKQKLIHTAPKLENGYIVVPKVV